VREIYPHRHTSSELQIFVLLLFRQHCSGAMILTVEKTGQTNSEHLCCHEPLSKLMAAGASDSYSYPGLFGYTSAAIINNLGVVNVGVKGYPYTGTFTGCFFDYQTAETSTVSGYGLPTGIMLKTTSAPWCANYADNAHERKSLNGLMS
jgi:hypothetical protein